jgi:hypothetical protein
MCNYKEMRYTQTKERNAESLIAASPSSLQLQLHLKKRYHSMPEAIPRIGL